MKCLVLGSGRFASIKHPVVSMGRPRLIVGGSAPVKKDLFPNDEGKGTEGMGIKKKLKPLKFKM